jgi:tRNA(His) guanylyltransferase
MKFDTFETKMRVFETASDYCVLPNVYMVARLDGRNFTRLTKELYTFQIPYDIEFRNMMIETVKHLMECGFKIDYAYTQSDEISLLFALHENTFSRKMRKYHSVLAGEASAKFSLLLGEMACFDCRISQLPTTELVCDYFRWRQEDAHRNALNSHCYWVLRKRGQSRQTATNNLLKRSVADKNELLFQQGLNFNELPSWQKRGVGLYWETDEKEVMNPQGEPMISRRKRIKCEFEVPLKEQYSSFLFKLMGEQGMG